MGQRRHRSLSTPSSVSNMRSLVPLTALLSVVQALSAPSLLRRTSQDSCGHVAAALVMNRIAGGVPLTIGFIGASLTCFRVFRIGSLTPDEDSCLCLSQIPSFLTTNLVAKAGVQLFGVGATTSAITTMVVSGFQWTTEGVA